jgi:putative ABC transport system permease protein
MEIRPILSALLRNKTSAILIGLQIAFTFAVIVNSAFIITTRIEIMTRPTGLDEADIFSLRTQGFLPDFDHHGMIREDMDWLVANSDIVGATPINQVPLSGGGWSSGLEPEEDLERNVVSAIYWVTEQGVPTLGVELIAGRDFTVDDIQWFQEGDRLVPTVAIMTRAMAEEMWPGETEYVGRRFQWGDDYYVTVVGLIEQMHGAWVGWEGLERVTLMAGVLPGPGTRYLIRTTDGQRDTVLPVVEEGLPSLNSNRVVESIHTLDEYKADSYQRDQTMSIIMAIVMVLLIAITGLGIVGLASFSVTQRFKQIGTRRALGARKFQILRYFLTENWLVTTMGLLIGTGLTVGLNIWLVHTWDLPKLNWTYIPTGMVFLWAMSQLATWQPARRASNISPAVATRTV